MVQCVIRLALVDNLCLVIRYFFHCVLQLVTLQLFYLAAELLTGSVECI